MVRDAVAWYRPGGHGGPVLQFSRVEVRQPLLEADAALAHQHHTDTTSVWVDPLGRVFDRLDQAVRQCQRDRLAHLETTPAKGALLKRDRLAHLETTPAKGSLLKRDIARGLTPGTVLEEGSLAARREERARMIPPMGTDWD